MQAGKQALPTSALESRYEFRRKCSVLGAVLVVVALASLCIAKSMDVVYSPVQVADAFGFGLKMAFDSIWNNVTYNTEQVRELCPQYFQVMGRASVIYISVLAGAMIALAGSLYQMAFRNPIAAPTMLGVGNGITLGLVMLVFIFGTAAPYLTGFRYLFTYLGAFIILALVVVISLAIGKGHLVMVDMLLVGSIFTALLGQVIVFFTYSVFTTEAWTVYNTLNEVLDINTEGLSLLALTIVFALGFVPLLLFRFKMNVISFPEDEMRLSGVSPNTLRTVALCCGTVLIVGAQVHVGTIAMAALIVPYASRRFFGAEFNRQMWGDILIGAILVVLCNDMTSFVEMWLDSANILIDCPIGLVANFIMLPLFAWVISTQQKNWE